MEFAKSPNPNLSPPDIAERVLHELFDELVREFHIVYDVVDIPPDRSTLVDLDSSTPAKFSRHWILHLPGGALFPDAREAGVFVRGFVSRLMEERSNGELRSRGRDLLADNLLVYTDNDDANENAENDDDDIINNNNNKGRRQTHFIDMGVYTRNRIFRLLGSTKFGKPPSAALRIAETNRYPFPTGFDNAKFYRPAIALGEKSSPVGPNDGRCTVDRAAVAVVSSHAHTKKEFDLESCVVLFLNVLPLNKWCVFRTMMAILKPFAILLAGRITQLQWPRPSLCPPMQVEWITRYLKV